MSKDKTSPTSRHLHTDAESEANKKRDAKAKKRAREQDQQAEKLKAKQFRNAGTERRFNKDLVADQSWHTPRVADLQVDNDEVSQTDVSPETIEGEEQSGVVAANGIEEKQAFVSPSDTLASTAPASVAQDHRGGHHAGGSRLQPGFSPQSVEPVSLTHGIRTLMPKPLPFFSKLSHQLTDPDGLLPGPEQPLHKSTASSGSALPLRVTALIHHAEVKEDSIQDTVGGHLVASGDGSHSVVWSVNHQQGTYGELTLDRQSGEWRYHLDNQLSATNALAEGEHRTEQFLVTATDRFGQRVVTSISVEVEGSNDKPVISGLHNGSLNEQDVVDEISGQLTAVDPDHGETLQWAVAQPQGHFGRLSIDADTGLWRYHLDNQSPATQALAQGQQGTETFLVTVTDSSGNPVQQVVTVAVHGTNQAASVTGVCSGQVHEDHQVVAGWLHAQGQLGVSDPDLGESAFKPQALQGHFGQLTIDSQGHWQYSAHNSDPLLQGLRSGEHLEEHLTVQTVDGTQQVITISLAGSDDKAVISGVMTGTVQEDKTGRCQGRLDVQDADFGQAAFVPQTQTAGHYGTFSVDSQGHWHYALNNTHPQVQALSTGDNLTEHFTINTLDGTSQVINVKIAGTNDTPVVAHAIVSQQVDEDSALSFTLPPDTFTDIDQGDSVTLSASGLPAWLHFDAATGTFSGTPANGDVGSTPVTVTATDRHGAQISTTFDLTVNNTNDAPTLTPIASVSVDEDGQQASGQLIATDPDVGDRLSYSIAHPVPGLTFHPDGSWVFDPSDAAYQSLPAGQRQTLTIPVTVTDAAGATDVQNLVITVNGTNDGPVVNHTLTAAVADEDTAFTFTVPSDTFADIDRGDSLTLSASGLPAWLHFDVVTGTFSGTPANGDVGSTPVTVTATDSHGAQISTTFDLSVNNTNDAPTLTPVASVSVDEDAQQASGQLIATDPDVGDTLSYSIAHPVPGLTFNPDGSWVFDPSDAAYQSLPAGQSQTLTIPVTVTDAVGATDVQNLVITVNGTNDGARMGGLSQFMLSEDQNVINGELNASGRLVVLDVDSGEAHVTAQSVTGQYGRFSIDELGHWHYTADNSNPAIQALGQNGQGQIVERFTVSSSDGSAGRDVVIRIMGTNDGPVVNHTLTAAVADEDTAFTFTVPSDTFADIDRGDSLTLSASGLPAWLHFDVVTGTFSGTPANGDVGSTPVTVTATDRHGAQISTTFDLSVNNVNDVPTLTPIASVSVDEDGQQASGQLIATDPDVGDRLSFSIAHPVPGLTFNPDGSWVFDPSDAAYQSLPAGQSQTLTIPVTVTDAAGATDVQNLVITVNGTNDGPVVNHTLTAAVADEDTAFSFTVPSDTFADIDRGDSLTLSASGLPAWLHFDAATGTFSGTPANGDVGNTPVTVTATDRHGAQISTTFDLTVNNTNDAPTFTPIASVSVDEDGQQASGQLLATDPDVGDTLSYSIAHPVPGLTFHPDGSWVFDPSDAAYQSLPAGQSQTLTIPVTVTDAAGATDVQNLVITVNGTNDGARMGGLSQFILSEDQNVTNGELNASGRLVVLDVDSGEAHITAQSVTGQYGRFSIDELGHWHYTADNSNPAIQALGQNGQGQIVERFTVSSADGSAGRDVVIRIMGTNDGPVVNHTLTAAVADEDTAFSFTVPSDTFADIDRGDSLTLSASGLPAWLHFDAATGTFSGTPTNGDVGSTPVTVTATDRHGAQISTTFDLTVNNTNDAPTFTPIASVSVDEDGQQASGQLIATDPDVGDTLSYSIAHPVPGLTFHPDGSWVFDPSDAAYQSLPAGQSQTLTIPVTVTDAAGATDVQNLVITVNGTNDGPVVNHTLTAAVADEDTAFSFTVPSDTFADIDRGDSLTLSASGLPAWLHFDAATGTFSGTPTNGDVGSTPVTVTATDRHGAQISTTFDLTVNNVNDVPTLTPVASVSVDEDGQQASGQLIATDPDAGDRLSFSIAHSVPGLTFHPDGSWVFDPSDTAYQSLPAGQSQTLNIPVTVTDNAGATDTQTLTITVTGRNDGAIISGGAVQLTEDVGVSASGDLQAGGQLVIQDVDQGEAAFRPLTNMAGSAGYGQFSLSADGQWQYHCDNSQRAVQALAAGEPLTDSLTVTSVDGTAHTIAVTIQGTNDTPVVAHAIVSQQVDEDAQLQFTLPSDTFTDIDHGDNLTLTASGLPAWLHFDVVTGTFSGTPANGDVGSTPVTVTATDRHGAQMSTTFDLTVNNTNDAPTLTPIASVSVDEDGQQASGQLLATDPDVGDRLSYSIAYPVPGLTFHPDGRWVFDPSDTAYQSLPAGQSQTLTIPVTVTDAAGATDVQNLVITVNGTNDGARMGGLSQFMLSEDQNVINGELNASGRLVVLDADSGEAHVTAQSVTGQYGRFSIDELGHWHYTADNSNPAIQVLGQNGQGQIVERFTVSSADGSAGRDVVIRIMGTNDGPVVNHTLTAAVADEDTAFTFTVPSDTFADIDRGDSLTLSVSGLPAWLHFDVVTGTFSGTPANGDVGSTPVTVTATDRHGAQISTTFDLTVNNVNDVPTLTPVASVSVDEDGQQASGQLIATDPDAGDRLSFSIAHPVPGLTFHPDGSWVFDPSDAAYQSLPAGQSQTLTIPVTVTDAAGATDVQNLVITVNGTNDGPVVNHTLTAAVADEDTAFSFTVPSDTFADIDRGDSLTLSASGLPGWLHFDAATATFSGTPANGDVGSTPVTVTATDRHGAQISTTFDLTVNNTNDAPTFTPIASVSVDEDGQQASGQLIATDPDVGDKLSFSIAHPVPGLTFNPDGSWVFDPSDTAYQSLPAGQSQTLTIPVTVTDAAGATDVQNLVITVNGTNDGARMGGLSQFMLSEDQNVINGELNASGRLVVLDVDSGEAHVTAQSVTGQYGRFSIDELGHWHYTADNSNPAIQALGQNGQGQIVERFTVSSSDGSAGRDVVIRIMGTNDGPVVNHTLTAAVADEDTAFSFTVPSDTFADIDHGDSVTLSVSGLPAWLHFDAATGTFSGTPANGDVGSTPVTVTATDRHGAQISTTFDLTVNNTNDAPTLTPIASVTVDEDGQQASGQLLASDPDAGDKLSFSIAHPVPGLTFNPDGSWVFDPSDAAYQSLPAGQSQTLTIPVTVTDTAGASDAQTLTITVTGRNDSPTVTGTVVLSPGKEDTPVTIHSAVLLAQASDIDQGETGQLHVQHLQADHGSVVDNQDGTFTFTPDANYNGPVRFSYEIADPHGAYVSHSATLSLGAVADAAVIGGDDKGTVQEDVISGSGSSAYALRTSGQLTIQDPDTGEAEFEEHYAPLGFGSDTTLHGLYGNLRLFSDGSWDYAGNNAHPDVQGLGAGATPLTDVFVVHSVDGTPHTITISIAGTNDAPILLHSISAQQVDEDAQLQFTLPADTFADIDHGDNLTLTASGLPGWLHFDAATGTFSGTPSNQDVGSVPVSVTATDSQGESVTTQFTLTVNNTNDAPVLTPVASVKVAEDGNVVQGQLQASDADQGDQLHFSAGKVEGFTLNSDGSWSFNPSHSAYQHLAVGQSQTLNIPVTVTDTAGASDTQTIVITVTGTNDIPTLTLHAQNQMSGWLMSGDADSADTHTFGVTQAAGAFGDLSL